MSGASRTDRARIMVVIATIMLTMAFVVSGLTVCAGLPVITNQIASGTSDVHGSPYAAHELIELAVETRDFTVGDYGREETGVEGAEETLAEKILGAASVSADDPEKAERWSPEARALLDSDEAISDPLGTMEGLAEIDIAYGLDGDALSHLNDVNEVLGRLMSVILGIAVLSAFCLFGTLWMFGPLPAGRVLRAAGITTIVLFALIGAWALISFDTFFTAIHTLFFDAGTWTFPAHSLLISMYPEGFWMGMAVYWFTITILLAVVSLIVGSIICKQLQRPSANAEIIET